MLKKLDSFRSPLFNEELERESYETQLIFDQIVDYINQLPKYKPTEVGTFSNFNRLFPSLRLLSMEDATNPESNFERGVNRVRYYMQKKVNTFLLALHQYGERLFLKSGSICQELKFRGIFVKKASHLSRYVKGTLRNIKNVVGNFLTCTDGHKGGLKMGCLSSSTETRLGLKVPENNL